MKLYDSPELQLKMNANRERPSDERWLQWTGQGAPPREEIANAHLQGSKWILTLTVQRASDLAPSDWNQTSDPYVECAVWCPTDAACSHLWRTPTRLGTLNAQWDAEQVFRLTSTRSLLHVCVFDWDRFGEDDMLGEVLIDLDSTHKAIVKEGGESQMVKARLTSLRGEANKKGVTPTGYLHLNLRISKA